MNLTPENIERLDKILSAFNDGSVKAEELVTAVDTLVEYMNKARAELGDALSALEKRTSSDLERLAAELRQVDGRGRASLTQSLQELAATHRGELEQVRAMVAAEVARVQSLIPELPEEFDATGLESALEAHQSTLDELSTLIIGENIRNALEALPEGEKLAIDAIEGLRNELDELKKAKATVVQTGVTGRDIITQYDLSPSLDGVTKTFNIPATWAVISVTCSSFPSVLRPGIDYTNTPTTITFTNEIEASTTLATGQTVVLILVTA